MIDPVRHALLTALDGRDLSESEAAAAIGTVMDGGADELLVAALLTALRIKGDAASELVGAARAMRERVTKIPTQVPGLLDTCGTGGDGLATFNISTATAIVAAAAGVPVAKHGNRAASSSSGSADVLEALGVSITLTPEQVAACIDEVGIGFCFAPLCHGAMKNVAPIRKRLGFRTIFNLLGPLTNPAGADYQLVGAGNNETAEKLAGALAAFGVKRAVVVCGNNELDEVSFWGTTTWFQVDRGEINRHEFDFAQLAKWIAITPDDLRVTSPAESADLIRGALTPGVTVPWKYQPARQMIALNAGAALFAADRTATPESGYSRAVEVIEKGWAENVLKRLVEASNRLAQTS